MERSLAARLGRPLGLAVPATRVRPSRGARGSARRGGSTGRSLGLGWLTGAGRGLLAAVGAHRRLRIALVCLLVALPLLGGGWLWLRSSPLAAVEHVQLTGVHGPEAQAIEAVLLGAARRMSTLEVHPATLRAAVAPFRLVREVRVSPSFPHGLRIHVVEQLPVAALAVGTARSAVAADGVVLGPALLSGSLPSLSGSLLPATGARVRDPSLLGSLVVLGDAPAPLARLLSRVYTGPRGLTVVLRGGLLAYFGDATRPHAKWLSLARVLADPSSAGASYVDVRVPERPAAGFPAGVTPPGAAGASGAQPSASESTASTESTVAALAAGLTSAGGGAAPTGSGTGPPSSGTETASSGTQVGGASEAASGSAAAPASSEQPSGSESAEAVQETTVSGG